MGRQLFDPLRVFIVTDVLIVTRENGRTSQFSVTAETTRTRSFACCTAYTQRLLLRTLFPRILLAYTFSLRYIKNASTREDYDLFGICPSQCYICQVHQFLYS